MGREATLAVTPGEPAGIGPDLLIRLAQNQRDEYWVAIADAGMLEQRARQLGLTLRISEAATRDAGSLCVRHIALSEPVSPGILNVANVEGLMSALLYAADGCVKGEFDALVTGPMQKSIVVESGRAFSGHTEFLQRHAGVEDVLMLLVAGALRVAVVTTHIPLRDVADAIDRPLLESKLHLLLAGLKQYFDIALPRVAVTGLNPHAGEDGHLGSEEKMIIEPVCEAFRARGAKILGPLPSDTAFVPGALASFDAVLAMYHDQGLPVLKHAGFGRAVNVTLGLPYLRTSVDHGTALDLAGTMHADTGSMAAAIELAGRNRA
ncbi:MAG: 4-hydroxythreonine-4-phosphate dehydrogenase PdxA [Pseudomonadales bacterium]|jgi:4-hydroxythreonine-4-phosphate dehydrogenase|nr:4-hydroxythreonine-4-phosphate dehydrogenase PdxA [Pseudomonadales bacterium]MDP6470779.1 4-hydroxythreonine-4-phosphate dehydrogenase PdxA [Pseudomonadales bacterium]MDP6828269.1 4-hydroxythreonine-4-phosphate dehydrogenase PdxA [Pseudomonadales bacterium]MDP6973013.1 4-hydroxythreonine-4-phosphate dehydrogenase PdxA [Pseudomonadales bacterium]